MEILPLIIAVSLVLVALIAGLFVWAVRSDQFEDLEGPAWRVLQDDDTRPPPRDDPVGDISDEAREREKAPDTGPPGKPD